MREEEEEEEEWSRMTVELKERLQAKNPSLIFIKKT